MGEDGGGGCCEKLQGINDKQNIKISLSPISSFDYISSSSSQFITNIWCFYYGGRSVREREILHFVE